MIYVGVENSTAKVRIATRGPSRTIYVDPTDLAWDCQRHVAFLRDAETHLKDGWDEAWMLRSQYAGWMLQGVERFPGGARTHSMVMRSKTGTVRRIEATHNFTRKSGYK